MFLNKTSLRISLFGGSTDNPTFIKKYKKSTIINFSTNLYTYALLFRDKFGYNSIKGQYILNYSKREQSKKIYVLRRLIVRYLKIKDSLK